MNLKCEICEKVFSRKHNLRKHFNQQHNNSGQEYQCNVYTKKIQDKNNFIIKEYPNFS